jgi:TRAP transporter 4TM/12TM fusion protein
MEEKVMKSKSVRSVLIALNVIIGILSVVSAAFHIFITYNKSISIIQQRVFHVFLFIFLFYLYSVKNKIKEGKTLFLIINLILMVTALVTGIHYLTHTDLEGMRQIGIHGINATQVVFGVILMLMILDITRRTIGSALAIIAIVFVIYSMLGPFMPEVIAHRGYKIPYMTSYVAWTLEGVFGTPIGASVSFVALYIIFGELLDKFGAGKFFIDIAYALTGRMKGGPAEAAVLSSALMGSINGSAVANVVTTGTFTIPLMKNVGYSPTFAGAVEAVASTGGQILPPVMGAAAFVMADMTGISYSNIIIAAFVPGLLYYIALAISVYLEADRLGIKPEPKEKLPQVLKVLKRGWYYLIPLIVLILALLAFKLSANLSAIYAIVSLFIIGIVKVIVEEKRFPIKELYESAVSAARTTIPVAIACAAAGIVIGIVSMTGIGVKFTRIVFDLAGGRIFWMLSFIMIACIVLGMGLPSTAAYVIAATIGVPPLVAVGVPLLSANMFVFYFAIISFITPPVAIAAYAAAGLSGANAMKTGLKAFMLGLSGFIIPFVYSYNPALLIIDSSPWQIIYIILITLFSIFLLTVAINGWFMGKIHPALRVLLIASSVLIFVPGYRTDIIGIIAGAILIALIIFINRKKPAKENA